MRALMRIFIAWLPIGIAITGVCLLVSGLITNVFTAWIVLLIATFLAQGVSRYFS